MTPLPLCVGSGAARLDDVCLLLPGEGILDLSEERTEGGSELEHRSNVEVPTHPSYPVTITPRLRKGGGQWVASASSSLSPPCSPGGLAAAAERMKDRG